MKKFILTAVAVALTASPLAVSAAEAAPQRTVTTVHERPNGRTVVKQRTTYRTWRQGERFDRRHAQYYRALPNWRTYRLAAPSRGQHWVRSGRDAVLVRDNNVIVSVRGNVFR